MSTRRPITGTLRPSSSNAAPSVVASSKDTPVARKSSGSSSASAASGRTGRACSRVRSRAKALRKATNTVVRAESRARSPRIRRPNRGRPAVPRVESGSAWHDAIVPLRALCGPRRPSLESRPTALTGCHTGPWRRPACEGPPKPSTGCARARAGLPPSARRSPSSGWKCPWGSGSASRRSSFLWDDWLQRGPPRSAAPASALHAECGASVPGSAPAQAMPSRLKHGSRDGGVGQRLENFIRRQRRRRQRLARGTRPRRPGIPSTPLPPRSSENRGRRPGRSGSRRRNTPPGTARPHRTRCCT